MGKKSRESMRGVSEVKNANSVKLVADEAVVDPTLAALFATSAGPVKAPPKSRYEEAPPAVKKRAPQPAAKDEESTEEDEDVEGEDEDDEELSSIDGDLEEADISGLDGDDVSDKEDPFNPLEAAETTQKKRKRDTKEDDLEGKYLSKLAREEEKEEAQRKAERKQKKQKLLIEEAEEDSDRSEEGDDQDQDEDEDMEDASGSEAEPPKHESIAPPGIPVHESLMPDREKLELEKAARTVFLANVSATAITDKKAKKELMEHMSSFLADLSAPLDGKQVHQVESIRFRSTAFEGGGLPKKAAYATKALMTATTKSTNAYVVYSTSFAAREAVKRLNGTVVLDRHLRVDGVAHPSKVDHRRCVFVGNLGFVDDESNMNDDGEGQRKRSKIPSDIEEGLWRQFGKAGEVESVRVVRDEKTRVGKGFAYVQFKDANAVEAALLFDGKKYPPMLPRLLRVTRAKAMQKTAKAQERKRKEPFAKPALKAANPNNVVIYNPKMSSQQSSLAGRAARLLGKAGAATFGKRDAILAKGVKDATEGMKKVEDGAIKGPEAFIFEGYRASAKNGKPKDLKLGGKNVKSKGKTKNHGSKRASEWKKSGGAKKAKS